MKQVIHKVKGFLSYRSSEVLLGALLTIAAAVCGTVISAQVTIQERVTDNALAIVHNEERIVAFCASSELRDASLVKQITSLAKLSDSSDAGIEDKIDDLKERLDQRCDTLEGLLNSIVSTMNKPEEDR